MRIALFHDLPSGGAKRTLQEFTRRLSGSHRIDAFTLSCANHDFADIRPFVACHKVYPFKPLPLLKSPFGRLNQLARMADLLRLHAVCAKIAEDIREGGYDVAFVHPCQFEKASSILARLESLPSLYYCQEPLRVLYEAMPPRPYDDSNFKRRMLLNKLDPLPGLYRAQLRRNDRRNIRAAHRVLANSRFMRDAISGIYGVDAKVSYLGVDADLFRPLGVKKGDYALSVGSLTPLKGFDFLIRVVAALPAGQRPTLAIACNFQNPPEREYLQKMADDLGVELRLFFDISDKQLVRLYNEASVVLYAPVREPFGLVALESMACGTPVVAVREGGVQETVVHEKTGLLVGREITPFAAALKRLLCEPGMASELGRNARRHVLENWTWHRAATTLGEHFAACTGLRKAVVA